MEDARTPALALHRPTAQGRNEVGDTMTWPGSGWESIPGCFPVSSAPGGQLVLNLLCPAAFHRGELNFSFCFRFFLFLIHIMVLAHD